MRSNGPLANKEVAIGGHGWPWVARSSGVAESGRLVRRMSHHVDPAAIAEEARTVRLDAVLGPPRRSDPVGDSSTPESRTLTPVNHGSNPGSSARESGLRGMFYWVKLNSAAKHPEDYFTGLGYC